MSMSRLFDLTGKTALVTGSSDGLGLAIARGLAAAGAQIVLNGRDERKLATVAKSFEAEGRRTSARAFDVADEGSVLAAFEHFDASGVEIDILVNNAGFQLRKPMLEHQDRRMAPRRRDPSDRLVPGRARGGPADDQARARRQDHQRRLAGERGRRATIAPYTAAKGGIKMLTRAMAAEWAAHDIQANAIGPGYIDTEMTKPLIADPKFDSRVKGRTPSGRWGKPEDLIGVAVFLASPASAYVNGQVIYVDGGLLAVI